MFCLRGGRKIVSNRDPSRGGSGIRLKTARRTFNEKNRSRKMTKARALPCLRKSRTAARAVTEGEEQVHQRPRQSDDRRPEPLGRERLGPELDGLPPAEANQEDQDRPEGIEMLGGVKGQAPECAGHADPPGDRQRGRARTRASVIASIKATAKQDERKGVGRASARAGESRHRAGIGGHGAGIVGRHRSAHDRSDGG